MLFFVSDLPSWHQQGSAQISVRRSVCCQHFYEKGRRPMLEQQKSRSDRVIALVIVLRSIHLLYLCYETKCTCVCSSDKLVSAFKAGKVIVVSCSGGQGTQPYNMCHS